MVKHDKFTIILRIPHCDYEGCDMGQVEYDCAVCNKSVTTCTGWYEHEEGESFKSDCCPGTYSYSMEQGEWEFKE